MISEQPTVAELFSVHGIEGLLRHILSQSELMMPSYAKRSCPELSNIDFMASAVGRILTSCSSGREFLQSISDTGIGDIARSTFFDALASHGRMTYAEWSLLISTGWMANRLSEGGVNHLSVFPELSDRIVICADGHQVAHACHADPIDGVYPSKRTVYAFEMSLGLSFPVCEVISGETACPHEWPHFKKASDSFLEKLARLLPKKNPKKAPIIVYDPAAVDHREICGQMLKRIKGKGYHLITLLKAGTDIIDGGSIEFDKNDPVNDGVFDDRLIGLNNSCSARVVSYLNPETGEIFRFLTTETKLRPGVIAWLYFLRWRIEKIYDTFKNAFHERKAWATSPNAMSIQSHATCLTYNFLVMLQGALGYEFGIREDKLDRKRDKSIDARADNAAKRRPEDPVEDRSGRRHPAKTKRTKQAKNVPSVSQTEEEKDAKAKIDKMVKLNNAHTKNNKKGKEKKVFEKLPDPPPPKTFQLPKLLTDVLGKYHQFSNQFIRAVKNRFYWDDPIINALDLFRARMKSYL